MKNLYFGDTDIIKESYYEEVMWHHNDSDYSIRRDGEKFDVWFWNHNGDDVVVGSFDTFEECHIYIEELVEDENTQ